MFCLLAQDLGDKALTGLYTFLIGLVMVFAVLFILVGLIKLMKVLGQKKNTQSKISNNNSVQPVQSTIETSTQNDEELVAVITAVIANYMNNNDDDNYSAHADFVVKTIKKIS